MISLKEASDGNKQKQEQKATQEKYQETYTEEDLQVLVYQHEGIAVTDSLIVAEKFEKRHDNVLQKIEDLLKNKEVLLNSVATPLY